MSQASSMPSRAASGSPTWEIAHLFPTQGEWCEEEYLALQGNRLIELSDGFLEVLPMPTTSHQFISAYLYGLLLAFVTGRDLGKVIYAPLRVRLWRGQFREPDILFMAKEHEDRIGEKFWKGADLVMEVVSGEEEDRHRDLVTKRREYARAGIAEYWTVDPEEGRLTVLRLAGKRYVVHGEFGKGTAASSHLLRGFRVDVTEALSQGAGRTATKGTRKPRR